MRLIDADALKEVIEFVVENNTELLTSSVVRNVMLKLVDRMKTIEAEPVKGAWEIAIGYDPRRAFMCDQCHKMAFEPSLYCPHCGARMEENNA